MAQRFTRFLSLFSIFFVGFASLSPLQAQNTGFPYFNQLTNNEDPTVIFPEFLTNNAAQITADFGLGISNNDNQLGFVLVDNVFSDLNKGIQVEFDFCMLNDDANMGFFLYDGDVELTNYGNLTGLGYIYNRAANDEKNKAFLRAGLEGAYLGLAFGGRDDFFAKKGFKDDELNHIQSGFYLPELNLNHALALRGAAHTSTIDANKMGFVKEAFTKSYPNDKPLFHGFPLLAAASISNFGKQILLNPAFTNEGNLYIQKNNNLNYSLTSEANNYRRIKVSLVPINNVSSEQGYYVNVDMRFGNIWVNIIKDYEYRNTTKYMENANAESDISLCSATSSTTHTLTTRIPDKLRFGMAAFTEDAINNKGKYIQNLLISRPCAAVAVDTVIHNKKPGAVEIDIRELGGLAFAGNTVGEAFKAGGDKNNIDIANVQFFSSRIGGTAGINNLIEGVGFEGEKGTWKYDKNTGVLKYEPKAGSDGQGEDVIYYSVISKNANFKSDEFRSVRGRILLDNNYRVVKFMSANDTELLTVYTSSLESSINESGKRMARDQVASGKRFLGWSTNKNATENDFVAFTADTKVKSDMVVYPIFVDLPVKIKLDRQGGAGGTEEIDVAFGGELLIDDPKTSGPFKTGYDFKGYYPEPNGVGLQYINKDGVSVKKSNFLQETTLYAYWTPKEVIITLDPGDGKIPVEEGKTVKAVYDKLMPSVNNTHLPTRDGYSFMGYFYGGTNEQYYSAYGVGTRNSDFTSNSILHAQWKPLEVQVSFNHHGGTGGTPNVIAKYGEPMPTINKPSRKGHTFKGYFSQETGGVQYYNENVVSAKNSDLKEPGTLHAQWEEQHYQIFFEKGTPGSVSNVVYGKPAPSWVTTLPTEPNKTFKGWNENEQGTGKYYDQSTPYDKEADLHLHPIFENNSGKLTLDSEDAGCGRFVPKVEDKDSLVTHNKTTDGVAPNTLITVKAEGNLGYEIDYWIKNGEKENVGKATWSGTMPADGGNLTLKPVFKVSKFKLKFDSNKPEGLPTSAKMTGEMNEIEIAYGERVTIPNNLFSLTGHRFVGWADKAEDDAKYDNNREFTLNTISDVTLYAKWEPFTYKVVFNPNIDKLVGVDFAYVPIEREVKYGKPITLLKSDSLVAKLNPQGTYMLTKNAAWSDTPGGVADGGSVYEDETTLSTIDRLVGDDGVFTLYAQWLTIQHNLTYDANFEDKKGTSGTAPAMVEKAYYEPIMIAQNTGDLKAEGFEWNGWNTAQDGSGVFYAEGTQIRMPNDNLKLYANWERQSYYVTFYKSDNTSIDSQMELPYDSEIGTIPYLNANGIWDRALAPSKPGVLFVGWNTEPNKSTSNFENVEWTVPAQHTKLYPAFATDANELILDGSDPGHGAFLDKFAGQTATNTASTPNMTGNERIIVIAEAKTGYEFKSWTINNVEYAVEYDGEPITQVLRTTMPQKGGLRLRPNYVKLYNVLAIENNNKDRGEIEIAKEHQTFVRQGSQVPMVVTPKKNYAIDSLVVIREDNGEKVPVLNSQGRVASKENPKEMAKETNFFFSMPGSDVTVIVSFGVDLNNNGIADDNECELKGDYVFQKFDDVVFCDNHTDEFVGYQWFKNGVLIEGATRQFYCDPMGLISENDEPAYYSVEVTYKDGKKTRTCEAEFKTPKGGKKQEVEIYPNPTTAEGFTVECNLTKEELGDAKMFIYSEAGNVVQTVEGVQPRSFVQLPSGKYVGKICTEFGKEISYKVSVK